MRNLFLKKLIALVLALSLAFSLFATVAFAEGDSERAERFIRAVEEFSELADLDDLKSHLETVKSSEVYFNDVSYEGVSEALLKLADYETEITEAVAKCDAFINAVDEALMADADDYPTLKAAITEAEKYLKDIDVTYDGVFGARTDYRELAGALVEREKYTEDFLASVKAIEGKSDYKSILSAYNDAEEYIDGESFIASYPGVEEAMLTLDETDKLLSEMIVKANEFVTLINALGSGSDAISELLEAYAALDEVDMTAPGVSVSKLILEAAKDAYNEKINEINSDWSQL